MLTVTLFKEMLTNSIKEYAIDRFLDLCISTFSSKGKSIEEQFFYCIRIALISFSQKYEFEYDIDRQKDFFTKLFQQGEFLSDEVLIDILKTTVYLKFDTRKLNEWLDLIDRTISEEELTLLRDYILMKNNTYRHKNIVYPRILTAKPPLPPEEYLYRKESEVIIGKLKDSKK